MGCVATVAHLGGSKVIGGIPRALAIGNIAGNTVGDGILVSCIHERINIMITNADAYCPTWWFWNFRRDLPNCILVTAEHSPKTHRYIKC
ncbi:hypothetical protein REPUB_Repub15cG0130600 [Reevesia pubescens]